MHVIGEESEWLAECVSSELAVEGAEAGDVRPNRSGRRHEAHRRLSEQEERENQPHRDRLKCLYNN